MPRTAVDTRTQIMDAAQELVLRNGFAATSLDAILERVQLTKGAFFHHFRSKSDLAHALIERFARADAELLEDTLGRAERLSRDPVQQILILIGLLEETLDELTGPHPGCLFASYCYEAQLFDEEIHGMIRRGFLHWRRRLGEKFREALQQRRPRVPVEPEELADMLTAVAEGAYILSRATADAKVVGQQVRHYRNYLELLFEEA